MNNIVDFPISVRRKISVEPMLRALSIAHPDKIPPKTKKELKKKIESAYFFARVELEAQAEKEIAAELQRSARREQVKTNGVIAEEVMEAVCAYFKITMDDLKSSRKPNGLAHARFVSYYLCRELTTASFPAIARYHGDRNHTGVLYGARETGERLQFNPQLRQEVEDLFETLTGDRIPVGVLGVGG